jgi:hypothetical protein
LNAFLASLPQKPMELFSQEAPLTSKAVQSEAYSSMATLEAMGR